MKENKAYQDLMSPFDEVDDLVVTDLVHRRLHVAHARLTAATDESEMRLL